MPEEPEESTTIWVKTAPTPDGTFVTTIEIGEDQAITLTRGGAFRYAMVVLDAAQRAEYDAAVFAQIGGELGLDERAAALVVVNLRKDRPPIDNKPTRPLYFEPGVSQQTQKPFIHIYVDEKPVGQWDLPAAREHALHVMEAVLAADLDAGYLRELKGAVGLDDQMARTVVGELGKHREPFRT